MLPDQRIVTKIPLAELWDDRGAGSSVRIRNLDSTVFREFIETTPLEFVVADCGSRLRRIPSSQRFALWKTVQQNLADPEKPFFLDQFPNDFAYVASEWRGLAVSA